MYKAPAGFGWFVLIAASVLLVGVAFAGKFYYVIKDDQGRTRMYDTLPPDYAQKGYRVVNERGVTVEVVPPHTRTKPPEPELSERDKILLSTFYSVEDIIQARDRQIATLEGIIRTTQSNIEAYRRNLDKLRAQAAQGGAASPKLRRDVIRMEQQIADNQAFIKEKRREQDQVRAKYNRDVERFIQLKGGR